MSNIREVLEKIVAPEHPWFDPKKAVDEAELAINKMMLEARDKDWLKYIDLTRKTFEKLFMYQTLMGDIRDPDGKLDTAQSFVAYQKLEPQRKQFADYLDELKSQLQTKDSNNNNTEEGK